MSMIIPDGQVWLCSNVPFDTGYTRTKYYLTKGTQFSDISSKSVYTAANCMYIRNRRSIKLSCPATKAYSVNYMIYKNTSFENKYFYAFVTNVEYVNNDVFEFFFEIDVIQTYMFDYSIRKSYVEREHILNDTLYASRTEEALEIGDPIVCRQVKDTFSNSYKIQIITSFVMNEPSESEGTDTYTFDLPTGKIYGKTYCGLHVQFFESATDANSYLKTINEQGRIDGVIGINMVPAKLTSSVQKFNIELYPFNLAGYEGTGSNYNYYQEKNLFQGYTPVNKKLYNYPFRFVKVLNGRGSVGEYKWENSNVYYATETDKLLSFTEYMGGYANPELLLSATYNGVQGGLDSPNVSNMMVTTGSMPCSWTNDAYQAWIAQNANQLEYANTSRFLNLAKGTVNTLLGRNNVDAGYMGTVYNGLVDDWNSVAASPFQQAYVTNPSANSSATNTLINWYGEIARLNATIKDHELLPPESQVVSSTGQLAFDAGISGFTFQFCSIRKEYAKIIDDYFTMYGYACHEVKVPSHYSRKSFNYIKTVGCSIAGSAPASALRAIQNIYNNGITFWHTSLDNIGNYSLDNSTYNGEE